MPARPPVRYHGSKWRIAPWIISMIPEHRNYVEVFGGAAGVLLRKVRSRVEIYNDLDKQVVQFFKLLRHPVSARKLIEAIALTPFARDEHIDSYDPTLDPIESARRFVIRCYSGHGTCSIDTNDSNGFRSCDIRAGKSYAREWTGIPEALAATASRFQGVTIENLDFRRLIPKFDAPETLFFIDPPYPHATRSAGGKGYVHELSDHDHEQLAWMLHQLTAKVMICGYPCSLYDRLYKAWHRSEKRTSANGQLGAVPRIECMWTNFAPSTAQN